MKKHRLHDIVLGMVIMALVMGLAVPAFAAVATNTLQAHYMNIKLVIDGVEVTPKDAGGNVVEPFVVDGTTFLPVRAVGEALGKKVTWDGNTKTVYLGEVPEGAIKDWVGIVDIDKAMGGFTKNAKDLPHIAAAITETNAKVESGRGDFGARPDDAVTTQYIRLESHDSLDGTRKELWITGMADYLMTTSKDSKDYLKIIRAILEDTVSSSEDIEGIMEMVNQVDATMEICRNWELRDQHEEAYAERSKITDNIHEFDTVVTAWGGGSGFTINVLRIWSK